MTKFSAAEIGLMKTAAKYHARANKSDPFSYKRMLHYLLNGYEEPKAILQEALNILQARGDSLLEYA